MSAAGKPAVVAGYEILGELGRGGMGVVYRARHVALDRLVALKMILAGEHASEQNLARFRKEAEAVARLQHPHIVQIYEVGEQHGLPFFSLELVDGQGLDRKLEGRPLPPAEAAQLAETLARAMHAAHERGIVHRDLKPANVLLTSDGNPKITDFGLAKKLDQATGPTVSGAIIGTPSYMAPEQASGRTRDVCPAVDIYALGAILYEMLTGRPPFVGANPADTLMQLLSSDPVPPRRLNPRVPADLETVCLKCLRKEPPKRYATALALAEDLQRFGRGQPIQARPVGVWERGVKWARRRPAAAALVAVSTLGLAVLVVLAGALWSNAEQRASAVARLEEAREALSTARRELAGARRQTAEQEQLANQKRDEVRRLQEDSRQELEKTRSARREAQQAFEEAGRGRYVSAMALAQSYWRANDVQGADDKLDQCPPNLRHWEWHHLKRLCHAEALPIAGPDPQRGRAVAFSPDGRRVASVATTVRGGKLQLTAWKIRVWDARSGQELHELDDSFLHPIRAVAFSPDGKWLASAGDNKSITVWDLGKDEELFSLEGHESACTAVAFSPDGKWLASASADGKVKVWNAATHKELLTLPGHTGGIHGVAFSPNGKRLALASTDHTVKVWDVNPANKANVAGKELTLTGHKGAVVRLVFRKDGNRLASASLDNTVKIWDAHTGKELVTVSGHTSPVNGMVFSPDSKSLVTAGDDRTVRVWDVGSGKELVTLRGHAVAVRAVAFSGDGRHLLSVGDDGVLRSWDPAGRQGLRLPGRSSGLAFSPDGRRLATATPEGSVTVLDGATGAVAFRLRGHGGKVEKIVFNKDGKYLVSATVIEDRASELTVEVKVWDLATRQVVRTRKTTAGVVASVALSPDGRLVAVAEEGRVVRVWEAVTGKPGLPLKPAHGRAESIGSLAFSHDGRYLAVSGGDRFQGLGLQGQTTVVYDTRTGMIRCTCLGHRQPVLGMAFTSPAAQGHELLATASSDRTVNVWDLGPAGQALANGQLRFTLGGHTRPVRAVAFSPDGKRLVSVSRDENRSLGEIKIWDVATGQEVFTRNRPGGEAAFSPDGWRLAVAAVDGWVWVWDGTPRREILTRRDAGRNVAFSCDGRFLVMAGQDEGVRLYDPRWGAVVRSFRGQPAGNAQGHDQPVRCALLSPDGSLLASADEGGTIKLWDARTARLVRTLAGHTAVVTGLTFSQHGSRLASASEDKTVRVWDVATGRPERVFERHAERVLCVAFSPDDKRLASGGEDKVVRVWKVQTGRELFRLDKHDEFINGVAFSLDGRWLASASDDRTVKVWEAATGKEVCTCRGHQDAVRGVAFSPDSKRLASAGWDTKVKVWDVTRGRELSTFEGHEKGVLAVSFDPRGWRLASAGADQTVRVWDARPNP
jgi:WD40 repeat protein